MLRPVSELSWPRSFAVDVLCLSGASLESVASRLVRRLSASDFDACLFHGGVNDVSRGGSSFNSLFEASCSRVASSFLPFSRTRFLCSSICQTRSSVLNVRVHFANSLLRDFASKCGWVFISNDRVIYRDLSDDVHLSASGIAKIYRHFMSALRSVFSEQCA